MNKPQYFHFTLGPVQGFVAQARRTRDFWAGSFILSWLSAVAIKSVTIQGGSILFPKADDDFLAWLEGNPQGKKPVQGSVPNRFKAKVDGDFKPSQVSENVQTAWWALAEVIYENDLQSHVDTKKHKNTRDIWEQQIKHFWEISWAITDDVEDSALLDQRKNWRNHLPPAEHGVKCMMMDGLQELSGIPAPNSKAMDVFWIPLREQGKHGMKTDLREQEHLCAVAFVKRRFVRYFSELKQPMSDHTWILKGWQLKPGAPSVTYMAAVHWLEKALAQTDIEQLQAFHDVAEKLTDEHPEWDIQIKCIEESSGDKNWKTLDGNMYFRSVLENDNQYDQAKARLVINALVALTKSAKLKPATPFYAILMMDGDSLGKQMSDKHKQPVITEGLQQFTKQVPIIVQDHDGFLIYAGGDDVLVILPLEDAMPCAVALKQYYDGCFTQDSVNTSLSGAIEYAHIKMPLTRVLKDAHDLLDNVAKDGCGRDAIAVRVWKPGGNVIEWAQPWDIALENYIGKTRMVLDRLADELSSDDDRTGQFSSKFFYKIRERLDLLNPEQKQDNRILDDDDAIALMAAEYVSSGLGDQNYKGVKKTEHAIAVIQPLLTQCRPVYRKQQDADKFQLKPDSSLLVDGALLVRFLATNKERKEQNDDTKLAV